LAVSPKLSLTKVKELIDEGTERGQASIGFGGLWEPLLSKDLPEIIAYGREKGIIEAMFNTNGLLLDEERAKSLIKSGLTRIMISLDAVSPETYRQMRPGSDLRQVEENIRSFIKIRHEARSRLPLVRLSFCLTKINSSELIPFLERWEETVDFFSLQSYGRFDDKAPLLFPETTMTNTGLLESPSGKCAQPFKRLLVRHNGQVLPCCDLSGLDLSLGTAEQGLSSLWAGSDLGQLRTKLLTASFSKLPESCQKCQTKYQPPLGEIPLPY
jgi:radical SAM protein with 4Fe4S-binding SPASM domain